MLDSVGKGNGNLFRPILKFPIFSFVLLYSRPETVKSYIIILSKPMWYCRVVVPENDSTKYGQRYPLSFLTSNPRDQNSR